MEKKMGDELKLMLVQNHCRPSELANYLGVTRCTISKWFSTNKIPSKYHDGIASFFANGTPFGKEMKTVNKDDARSIYEIILPMTKDQKINVIQFILGTL